MIDRTLFCFLVLLLDALPCACHGRLFKSPIARTNAACVLLEKPRNKSGHPREGVWSIADGWMTSAHAKSPRVKTKGMGGDTGLMGESMGRQAASRIIRFATVGDLAFGQQQDRTQEQQEKVKRRRRFHRARREKDDYSGNLGSCCAVLPLCETYDSGEHGGFRFVTF